ncbi:MAG: hypothetical protein CSA07_05410 [Bacteroidia bacterium]|nr:MAG: hypothetical protein CSA07_05410 [Bacteroidia bacterium]
MQMIGKSLAAAVNTTLGRYLWLFLYTAGALTLTMLWAQHSIRGFPPDLVALDTAFGLGQGFLNILILSKIRRGPLRRLVAGGMVVFTTVLCIVMFYLVVNFGHWISSRVMAVVLNTNQREAMELLTNPDFYRPMRWPLLSLAGVGLLSAAVHRLLHPRVALGRWLVMALTSLTLGLFLTMNTIATASYFRFRDGLWKPNIRYLIHSAPEQLFWGYMEYRWERSHFEKYLASISQREAEVEVQHGEIKPFTLVIIVGESTRREYMHCYGYPLANTPRIDSLLTTGRMALYPNAIAPASHTISSVPESLSTHNIDSANTQWFQTPTLPQLLARTGFRMAWASNQLHFDYHSAPISAIANACDSVFYLMYASQDRSAEKLNDMDGALLPYLLQRADSTELFCQFVHLMGQHSRFNHRYPIGFEQFTAEDVPDKPEHQRATIAEYANAVLYGDYVLGEIIRRYEADDALVIFFSDHAQALYDDSNNPDALTHSDSMPGLRIPFIAYATPRFAQSHPAMWARIMNARERLFINDLFAQSLCQLLGMRGDFLREQENIFSPAYDWATHRTVLGMQYDYPDTVDAPRSFKQWLTEQ